jgi:hypothetical protein
MIREQEARFLTQSILEGNCAAVTGLSNMGKSALLRDLCAPAAQALLLGDKADDYLFVYVDCNLMPERSEQALHEVTLRSIIGALRRAGAQITLIASLNNLYQTIVEPPSPLRSPLAFDDALHEACEESGRTLVLLFDEFDDPFEKLAGRAYLNLRALKDQFRGLLCYITATERPLGSIRQDHEAGEFIELFDTRERWLGFMNRADTQTLAREMTEGAEASEEDIQLIVEVAGGHAGMLDAVVDIWRRILSGTPANARDDAMKVAREALDDHPIIRSEYAKLWSQLSDDERNTLIAEMNGERADPRMIEQLRTQRLLDDGSEGVHVGQLWQTFVRRQALTRPDAMRGVTVDIDSGEVYVDGAKVEPLTDLEYKLLLLLYGRLNKIVDKYTIVTNVWGETYLDSVDDARIEKLVSRLRSKLEPNAEEPRYLTTLRGRGYKLVG